MSMFYCSRCGDFADADDGCDAIGDLLICSECVSEVEEEVYVTSKPWCGFCGGDCYRPDEHGYDAPDYGPDDDEWEREPDARGEATPPSSQPGNSEVTR